MSGEICSLRPRATLLRFCAVVVLLDGLLPSICRAQREAPEQREPPSLRAMLDSLPSRYLLPRLDATEFSQPTRSSFADAATTATGRYLRGRVAVQHLNGGYGVLMDVGGGKLFHSGADLGWFDTGDPVFSIADGVVRHSGPGLRAQLAELGIRKAINGPVDYGNYIVIEHRVDGNIFRSLYGHLGDDRLVRQGDFVSAGQQIGTIGRKSGVVNGGYEPHVHVGIHEGAALDSGAKMARIPWQGQHVDITLAELTETEMRLTVPAQLPPFKLRIGGDYEIPIEFRDGECRIPATLGWAWSSSGAAIPGYVSSMEGFRDPVGFVKSMMTLTREAQFYQTSTHRPLETPSRVGKPAVNWEVQEWLNCDVQQAPTLDRTRGKVICLVCMQFLCPGSKSHAWPVLKQMQSELADRNDVVLLGLQTPFTAPTRNNASNFQKAAKSMQITCPLGHLREVTDEFADGNGLRGTPWVVLIDQEGTIQFSNFLVRAKELLYRIDELTVGETPTE